MRRMYYVVVLITLIAGLVIVGCAKDANSPSSPSVGISQEHEEDVFAATKVIEPCTDYGCDNKDPIATGCSVGAITVPGSTTNIYRNGTTTKIGYVELRWSSTCGTNWSRVTRTDGAWAEGMYAFAERLSPYKKTDTYFATGYTQIYSNMVYAPSPMLARAYGLIDQSWTSGSAYTGWY